MEFQCLQLAARVIQAGIGKIGRKKGAVSKLLHSTDGLQIMKDATLGSIHCVSTSYHENVQQHTNQSFPMFALPATNAGGDLG